MPSKSTLELRQQVGQLLIMGFDGTTMSARLRSMLDTLHPGGIILFKRNIEDAAQTHALLRDVQKAVSTPLFLCVDMEGGTVDRLRDVIAPVACRRRGRSRRFEEALPQAWPHHRRRSTRAGVQHRFCAGARPSV